MGLQGPRRGGINTPGGHPSLTDQHTEGGPTLTAVRLLSRQDKSLTTSLSKPQNPKARWLRDLQVDILYLEVSQVPEAPRHWPSLPSHQRGNKTGPWFVGN